MDKKQKIIYIYFMILPFVDVVTSLITRFSELPLSLGMLVKGITIVISILYILFWSKSKYRKISIHYFIMLFIFEIIYLLTKSDIWNLSSILNEIVYVFRYFYFPVMVCGLANIFEDFNIDNRIIKKILVINCISYVLLLLIPYITGTGFSSYRYSSMQGENGWFYAANETGTIMIVLSACILYCLDLVKKYKVLFSIPIILVTIIIGTKVSNLGLILNILMICFTFFIENKESKKTFDKIMLPALLLIFLGVIFKYSPAVNNLEGRIDDVKNQASVSEKKEESKDEVKYRYETIEDLIPNKSIAKVFTVVFSGRTDFFLKNYSIYYESSLSDKLFGLSWSNRPSLNYNVQKKLVEIDFLDIFLHYGILGFIVYFIPLFYFFYMFFKNRRFIKMRCIYFTFLLLLCLAISSFSGHVLAAPAVSIYLVLLMIIVRNYLVDGKELKNDEITILALHLGVGGIEKYLSSLCKMLKGEYKINIIATYKVQDEPGFYFDKDINITYLINDRPNKNELMYAIKSKNFISIIKEGFKSIRILYLKYVKNIIAISNIDSKYVITTRDFHSSLLGDYGNKNIIKIATEHNYHNNNKKYIKRVIKSLRNINYFVVVSDNLKNFYYDKIKNTKCIYIPNVIDELPTKKSNLTKNNIICVGRLESEKGHLDLIDIVREIKKEIKDIKLFLIGDGSLKEELKEKVAEYKLQNNVVFTGFLAKDEMEEYLLDSKLFVMTSHTESFGLVLIEAMSYGVPCIAFDSADGAKTILGNGCGVLISNRNKKKYAKNVIKLLNDDNSLKLYAKKGYDRASEFDIKKIKKQWIKLLHNSR